MPSERLPDRTDAADLPREGNGRDTSGESVARDPFGRLQQIYMRHREALLRETPEPLPEREHDRAEVDTLYPALQQSREKRLDASTLDVLVDSQAQAQQAALDDSLTREDRLAMVAVIVRRNAFPVVFVPHLPTLTFAALIKTEDLLADDADAGPPQAVTEDPALTRHVQALSLQDAIRAEPVTPVRRRDRQRRLMQSLFKRMSAGANTVLPRLQSPKDAEALAELTAAGIVSLSRDAAGVVSVALRRPEALEGEEEFPSAAAQTASPQDSGSSTTALVFAFP